MTQAPAAAEALAALHAAAFGGMGHGPRPWTAAEFAALLSAHGTLLVALPGGFALGRAAAGEAELLTLAVAPARRRQGLGRRLLAGFEAAARAAGAAEAFLEVAEDNAAARALYAAAGWRPAGRRRGYYRAASGAGADALILRKALSEGAAGAAPPPSESS